MTSLEEFSFIANQLEWLEARLRQQPPAVEDARLDGALNALACARAVIDQLARISSVIHDVPTGDRAPAAGAASTADSRPTPTSTAA